MEISLILGFFLLSLRGANCAGIWSQQIVPATRINAVHPHFAPTICGGNLRRYFASTVCAQAKGFGAKPKPKKQAEAPKKKSGKWQISSEEEKNLITSDLAYADRWQGLASNWKQAAQAAPTTGFGEGLVKWQSKGMAGQAGDTAQFARRKANEAAQKELPEVEAAWTAMAVAWEAAAKATQEAAEKGWYVPQAKSVGKACTETAKITAVGGEKFEEVTKAWRETADEFSAAAQKLEFKPSLELSAEVSKFNISTMGLGLIGLFVGSGVAVAMLHGRSSTSSVEKESLLSA